jgi:hypothetical protein
MHLSEEGRKRMCRNLKEKRSMKYSSSTDSEGGGVCMVRDA